MTWKDYRIDQQDVTVSIRSRDDLVDATVLFVYFGGFAAWSFGYKLYRYGHDLAPTAAVKVPPFTPPMFGFPPPPPVTPADMLMAVW